MSKQFTVAGVSKRNGEFKVRYANDIMRVKVLEKTGSRDIDLMSLPHAMDKDAIPAYLLSIDFDNGNREVRACLEQAAAERSGNRDAPKKEAKKPKKTKSGPSLDAIRAKAAVKKTPQVPALEGMTPLGLTPAEVEAVVAAAELSEIDDAPY
jgi:hypothetical protein